MTACWAKSKTGAKHPYYYCYARGCESKGKSVRRADIEGQFETLLADMKPSRTMFALVQEMFKQAWGIQSENEETHRQSLASAVRDAEKKIESLLDRIVEANTASVIAAYEKRIDTLEREKLVLREQLENTARNKRPFGEMFKLTMQFLANPQKIWKTGQLEHKRTVLKLAFAGRLAAYHRKSGFQTPKISSVFRMIEGINPMNLQMAEGMRFELTKRLLVYTLSRRAPSTARPPLRITCGS